MLTALWAIAAALGLVAVALVFAAWILTPRPPKDTGSSEPQTPTVDELFKWPVDRSHQG